MLSKQDTVDYKRIEKAIQFIATHAKKQPSLEEIAAHIHLSPFHFQRIFSDWAGTSPKKFAQFITLSYAKQLLKHNKPTLFTAHSEMGLSSTSRLHHLFVEIEGMTPAEYKNEGSGLMITYHYYPTPFGQCLVASTQKGICYMGFGDNDDGACIDLKSRYPRAKYTEQEDTSHHTALRIFTMGSDLSQIKLHLKGTPFQLKVWEALLRIPKGSVNTYGQIAQEINSPKASRAVGTAIGSNPIAYLIPCHRVIQQTGALGGYMWNPARKMAIIGWEQAKLNNHDETI